ncbi:Six-hairpin glycosidase-like protein [Aspergillus pseudodeflectus]|uniref:Six-hairpin glycosidase-like protein n=1 Tax=Aspergillus pseudodeflectus TaxID=176178 RepID=A0ABR4KV31_9EURO
MKFSSIILAAIHIAACVSASPYSEYILAPSSRTIRPSAVYGSFGSVARPHYLCTHAGQKTVLNGLSSVTYDFGKNIAGIVSIDVEQSSSPDADINLTFSESSLWISNTSSDATADEGLDAPLVLPVGEGDGVYMTRPEQQRGGFRYLTVVHNSTGSTVLRDLYVQYTAAPAQNLREYTGYFHSNDELLNRIWYAGAYTAQLATIDPAYGNSLTVLVTWPPAPPSEYNNWYSNWTITNGSTALTDGGKRDRLVWGGDMTISLETVMVSTYDLDSVRNALDAMLALQTVEGRLPYASTPFPDQPSFTYHLHTLINFAAYYQYTGDRAWLATNWGRFKDGVAWAMDSIDATDLAYVAANTSSDWLRSGMGGHNIEANAILHEVLLVGTLLAVEMEDGQLEAAWTQAAKKLKAAANTLLWDEQAGLFRDNETSTLYPQDGNSWAIRANLSQSSAHTCAVSSNLRARWGPYGAPAPEAGPSTISPFIGGFELQAHYLAGQAKSALDLIRLQWGFMLDDPRMTGSSFIEGYTTDGSLRYGPYGNDARISHSHAWSSGPTAVLSRYTAGIQVTGGGSTWTMAPSPGDLRSVDAGFTTAFGKFSVSMRLAKGGSYSSFSFTAPVGTLGTVRLNGVRGNLVSSRRERIKLVNGSASGVGGGRWFLVVG